MVYAGVKYVMIRYIQRTDEMEETLRQLQLQYAVMDVTLRSIKDSLRGHRISINDTTID